MHLQKLPSLKICSESASSSLGWEASEFEELRLRYLLQFCQSQDLERANFSISVRVPEKFPYLTKQSLE